MKEWRATEKELEALLFVWADKPILGRSMKDLVAEVRRLRRCAHKLATWGNPEEDPEVRELVSDLKADPPP